MGPSTVPFHLLGRRVHDVLGPTATSNFQETLLGVSGRHIHSLLLPRNAFWRCLYMQQRGQLLERPCAHMPNDLNAFDTVITFQRMAQGILWSSISRVFIQNYQCTYQCADCAEVR